MNWVGLGECVVWHCLRCAGHAHAPRSVSRVRACVHGHKPARARARARHTRHGTAARQPARNNQLEPQQRGCCPAGAGPVKHVADDDGEGAVPERVACVDDHTGARPRPAHLRRGTHRMEGLCQPRAAPRPPCACSLLQYSIAQAHEFKRPTRVSCCCTPSDRRACHATRCACWRRREC